MDLTCTEHTASEFVGFWEETKINSYSYRTHVLCPHQSKISSASVFRWHCTTRKISGGFRRRGPTVERKNCFKYTPLKVTQTLWRLFTMKQRNFPCLHRKIWTGTETRLCYIVRSAKLLSGVLRIEQTNFKEKKKRKKEEKKKKRSHHHHKQQQQQQKQTKHTHKTKQNKQTKATTTKQKTIKATTTTTTTATTTTTTATTTSTTTKVL